MKNLFRKLSIITLFALTAIYAQAQNSMTIMSQGVVSNLFSVPKIIEGLTVTSTTSTNTIVYFFDTSNTTTTIVRAAYSRWASYATNFSNVFTNEAGILVTNSFVGIYTGPTAVAAITNSRPVVYTIALPGNSTRVKIVDLQPIRGLAAVASQDAIIEVDYRNQ